MNLETTEVVEVEIKALKSAPAYLDVIPKQIEEEGHRRVQEDKGAPIIRS